MKSNEGYINVVSVMQKYFDQGISGNWSYNPENYDDNTSTCIYYGTGLIEYI